MDGKDLAEILRLHKMWSTGVDGGKRADLQGANLQGADLWGAYLRGADLQGADLRGAYLQDADLRSADLQGANLQGAYLQGANLQDANLRGAKNTDLAEAMTVTPCEGSIIAWKKARTEDGSTCIIKLRIPEVARRSSSSSRKCRAEWAEVLEIFGANEGISSHDPATVYRVGETVHPDSWDEDRWEECSHGIHFFITRAEAEAWTL